MNPDLPIRFDDDGELALNELDSLRDLEVKAEVLLRFRPGMRDDLPEFGCPPILFQQSPPDLNPQREAFLQWVPEGNYDLIAEVDEGDLGRVFLRVEVDEPPTSQ